MDKKPLKDDPLAARCAAAILDAFGRFQFEFKEITYNARSRFEKRDWPGMQSDALERLDLYKKKIDEIMAEVKTAAKGRLEDRAFWKKMKEDFSALATGRGDLELAETFYNSVTRKTSRTRGIDPELQFVQSLAKEPEPDFKNPLYFVYPAQSLERVIGQILSDCRYKTPFQDLKRDCKLAADKIKSHLALMDTPGQMKAIEVIKPIFYRSNGAFLVGRIRTNLRIIPLVFCLLNPEGGLVLDAVLLNDDDVSIVFSFTHSYFHVKANRPAELIAFLRSILPLKPVSELYISIGYNKHGKTELYRDLLSQLESSKDAFEIAKGEKGMVMVVFTLPSYDVVFKIIKDQFNYPKKTSRQDVMARYRLVFKHDRAGRLVDAQEFEHFEFRKDRFSQELLTELLRVAPGSVSVSGDTVVIEHLYTERRLVPLNLYIKEAPLEEAKEATIDFGNAIKDMANANIFPGDILLKNFGVTRHKRVVFYDYDELCLLTDCQVREIPEPRDYDEEMEAEPWYYVQDADIFPEEFKRFLGFQNGLKEAFAQAHAELFTVEFWKKIQERLKKGEIAELFPYKADRKLRPK